MLANLREYQLTLLGRSLLLIGLEIFANVVCWIVAIILFRPHSGGDAGGLLSLAMLSWTIGLRHALDADHISAIDNATRGLMQLGQLPVTCGLFFSLGHSTIVVIFIVAIAISTDIFDKAGGFGDVGGIIGASISGSFLFLIGVANSITLYQVIKRRRLRQRQTQAAVTGLEDAEEGHHHKDQMLLVRILSPVTRMVDRPWKMYPVGVLFGLGFDTASSIALLAVAALGKHDASGKGIPSASIVILPLLFTTGMTLVDSLDSILMLFSYAGFPERGWKMIRHKSKGKQRLPLVQNDQEAEAASGTLQRMNSDVLSKKSITNEQDGGRSVTAEANVLPAVDNQDDEDQRRKRFLKDNAMSGLSIVLTIISIFLAFTISLITILSLIGDNCRRCREAAEADDGHGGGLAGRWWRAWAAADDVSGYIGAGIVGGFAVVVAGWYGGRWLLRRSRKNTSRPEE